MSPEAIGAIRASGWTAALLLVAALSMTPLGRAVGRRAWLVRARRGLGIASALAALVHAGVAIALYLGGRDVFAAVAAVPWLRSGALALALLLFLLLTSSPRIVAALRIRLWKPLHRLAYAAAGLALHHALLAPFAPRAWGLGLLAILAAGLAARALPTTRGADPQRSPTDDIRSGG